MSVRLVVAAVLLVALAGGLWWTGSMDSSPAAPVSGRFGVFVVGPEGAWLANGTVDARGTPFDALQALADAQGFDVTVEQQPWIGSGCTATYVAGIAGQHESASGGWNYYTRQAGEVEWSWGSAGAACHSLEPGDEVEWCWVEADSCGHHVP